MAIWYKFLTSSSAIVHIAEELGVGVINYAYFQLQRCLGDNAWVQLEVSVQESVSISQCLSPDCPRYYTT